MQFADIKNDIAFRKIFGNENKKEILISFLNPSVFLRSSACVQNQNTRCLYQNNVLLAFCLILSNKFLTNKDMAEHPLSSSPELCFVEDWNPLNILNSQEKY